MPPRKNAAIVENENTTIARQVGAGYHQKLRFYLTRCASRRGWGLRHRLVLFLRTICALLSLEATTNVPTQCNEARRDGTSGRRCVGRRRHGSLAAADRRRVRSA